MTSNEFMILKRTKGSQLFDQTSIETLTLEEAKALMSKLSRHINNFVQIYPSDIKHNALFALGNEEYTLLKQSMSERYFIQRERDGYLISEGSYSPQAILAWLQSNNYRKVL